MCVDTKKCPILSLRVPNILGVFVHVRRQKSAPILSLRVPNILGFFVHVRIQKSAPILSLRVPNILGRLLLEGALETQESLQEGESTEAEADEDDDTFPHPVSAWRVIAHRNRRGE